VRRNNNNPNLDAGRNAHAPEPFTPRLPSSGFSTPTTVVAPKPDFARALDARLSVASPRRSGAPAAGGLGLPLLPPPVSASVRAGGAVFQGASAKVLERMVISPVDAESAAQSPRVEDSTATVVPAAVPRRVVAQEFELTWLPVRTGFVTLGGLRVLVVDDRTVDEHEPGSGEDPPPPSALPVEARVLKQWDVVAELSVVS
jgi:trafficking protein particle complex subunit 13